MAKQARTIRITTAVKDKFTLPTLHFILHALEIYQKYEKLFQKTETTIHLMYDKQVELFQTTLLYFCPLKKIEELKDATSLLSFDYAKKENNLPLNDISIGREAKKIISGFAENDRALFLSGVKRFLIKMCDQLTKNLPFKNKFLANLRFLQPDYRKSEGESMILKCADKMPPIFKLSSREMDALSIEWKHLVLQDLPEIPKINGYIPVDVYWKTIFNIKDNGEAKYPYIEKVVHFAFSIAEANAEVERIFSQVFHIIGLDRNRIETDTLRGLLVTKSYIQTIGTCLNFEVDESMMASILSSHTKYSQRTANDDEGSCMHKRILEDANENFKKDKTLKKFQIKRQKIEEQEKVMMKKQAKAKLLIEQAKSLMEDTQNMSEFLCKEKAELEISEKRVQKAIIKSSCKKAISKKFASRDINNNQTDSDSN